MKKTVFVGILTLTLLLVQKVNAENTPALKTVKSNQDTLYFSPLPTSNTRLNLVKIQPVANYLSQILMRPVKPKLYESYREIIQAMSNNEIQFAELGPLPFLTLQEKSSYITPLATVNKVSYNRRYECVLAAPSDGIQSIEQLNSLKHPRVALTQPDSTCGWLVTHQLLQEHGFDLAKHDYAYLGSQQKVALALIRKEYSIGGLARFIAERYQPLGLEILKTSDSMPPFVLVANTQTLSPIELEKVTQALVNYQPSLHKDFNSLGFAPYSPELFTKFKQRYPNRAVPLQSSLGNKP